jgi:2-polyprenyl-3-methyl-5-hydroxy-6-metoxy-1,4-benzoquinol methylase
MYPFISEISRNNKLKLIQKHCSLQDSILEVGSGNGWLASKLRQQGFRVTTLDLSEHADIVGDINQWEQLGLQRGSFDVVIALEVIEHIDCWDALCALCKTDGLIMLSSPHPSWDWVMKVLEYLGLNQKRTSPHDQLTDFRQIKMPSLLNIRPALIHQVAIFINRRAG